MSSEGCVVAKRKKIRVFYAWQSDLAGKTNHYAIRDGLRDAATKLNVERPTIKVVIDEATRGKSGSPNIPASLLKKIDKADIFVADVTTITAPGPGGRPCPNPNVVYELGYASAEHGWDRIIFLFNDAFGTFPTHLPFDFAQHRGSPYTFAPADGKAAKDKLAKFLKLALEAVLDKDPKRPAQVRGVSRKKIEHDRDVANMSWLMSSIHLPSLEDHIEHMPYQLTSRDLWFWEHVNGVLATGLFDVYDTVLKENTEKLHNAWRESVSHSDCYRDANNPDLHLFGPPRDMGFSPHQQEVWDKLMQARQEMAEALDAILKRLRKDYIEIDVHVTNSKAWRDYVEFHKDFNEAVGNNKTKQKTAKKKKPKRKP